MTATDRSRKDKKMQLMFDVNEEQLRELIQATLDAKIQEAIKDNFLSWDIKYQIKQRINNISAGVIEEILLEKSDRDQLSALVDKTIDSIINSKVKKAIKKT